MKKLARAERYKRNYRLIKNTYQDTKLAKRGQTWSDERLYKELGIKITKSTPKLKKIKKSKQAYYDRKLRKFQEARLKGLSVERSIRVRSRGYSKKVIKKYTEYEEALDRDYSYSERKRRETLWGEWSDNEGMKRDEKGRFVGRDKIRDKLSLPPEIVERAIQRNRDAKVLVNGKWESCNFDDYDKYGFAVEYYAFTLGSEKKALKMVEPTKYGEETYRTVGKITA